jgi:hypothetical protein
VQNFTEVESICFLYISQDLACHGQFNRMCYLTDDLPKLSNAEK